jgi:hypothetical protein
MGSKVRLVLALMTILVSIQAIVEPARRSWGLWSGRSGEARESSAVLAARVLEQGKPVLKGVERIGFIAERPVNTLEPGSVEGRLYFTQMVLAPILVVPEREDEDVIGDPWQRWALLSLSPGYDKEMPGLIKAHRLMVEKELAPRRVLGQRVGR